MVSHHYQSFCFSSKADYKKTEKSSTLIHFYFLIIFLSFETKHFKIKSWIKFWTLANFLQFIGTHGSLTTNDSNVKTNGGLLLCPFFYKFFL